MAYTVTMPKLGLTMTEGVIAGWLKNVGDPVEKGDPLFVVETDKITNQVEALSNGILRKILVQEGDTVPVGQAVAILRAADKPLSNEEIEAAAALTKEEPTAQDELVSSTLPTKTAPTKDLRASPAAKKLARDRGVDLTLISPSRKDGRIVEKDVLAFLEKTKTPFSLPDADLAAKVRITPVAKRLAKELGIDWNQLATSGRIGKEDVFLASLKKPQQALEQRQPLAGMRKTIAQRMLASWQIAPHVTYTMEVDMTLTRALYNSFKAQGRKISYNDVIVLAAARALRQFPSANASLQDGDIILHQTINVGVAVALAEGLIVPVVKGADNKSLYDLSQEIRELVVKARENRLSPDDVTGGTFTVTNLGMYGVDNFTPIINQPEIAILGAGRIADKPAVQDGNLVVKPMMTLSLSADHRLLDGAETAKFLAAVKTFLQQPALML